VSIDIRDVVAQVDGLASVRNVEYLRRLQELVDCYFGLPEADDHLEVWFRLYERFPDEDGYGVFWSILHSIEAQPGYDVHVVASVNRRPTRFPLSMVYGMLNARIQTVGGVPFLELLRATASDARCSESVQSEAEEFLWNQAGASSSTST
jgi:hypothetical protein